MKSNNYYEAAQDILKYIGGPNNITSAAHCATRLRLVLKDQKLVNKEELEKLEIVKGVFLNGGQFQNYNWSRYC